MNHLKKLGGRFGYFLFFCSREGEGSPRRQEGGELVFLLKIPGGGVGGRGAGRVCDDLGNFLGGAFYFFRGRNFHQEKLNVVT